MMAINPCIAKAFCKALTPLNIFWRFKPSIVFPCNPKLLMQNYETQDVRTNWLDVLMQDDKMKNEEDYTSEKLFVEYYTRK